MAKYRVTLIITDYVPVEEEYARVEVRKTFDMRSWEDAMNMIAYMVDGNLGDPVRFEVSEICETKF